MSDLSFPSSVWSSTPTLTPMSFVNANVGGQNDKSKRSSATVLGDIASLGDLGVDIANTVMSGIQASKQNKFNNEVFEYNKQLNKIIQQREDSAMVRRMQDLKNAGLNPLLAVGGDGASSSGMNQLSAPAVASPTITSHLLQQSQHIQDSISRNFELASMKNNLEKQTLDNALSAWKLFSDAPLVTSGLSIANNYKQTSIEKMREEIDYLSHKKDLTDSEKAYKDALTFRYAYDNSLLENTRMPSSWVLGSPTGSFGKIFRDFIPAVAGFVREGQDFGLPGAGLLNGIWNGIKSIFTGSTDAGLIHSIQLEIDKNNNSAEKARKAQAKAESKKAKAEKMDAKTREFLFGQYRNYTYTVVNPKSFNEWLKDTGYGEYAK